MSESLSVHGVCESVELKNGWHTFKINIGKQYPVALSTKKASLAEQAMAAGQQVSEWVYVEKESDRINEHTGKPYVNRWLEEVHVGAASPQTAAKPQTVAQQAGRNESIERQTVMKAVLALIPPKLAPDDAFAYADKWAAWVAGGAPKPLPSPDEIQAAAPGSSLVSDDDIPFGPAIW